MNQKKLVILEAEDMQALATIKAKYGCESDSQAIRLSLRVLAASPMLTVTLPVHLKPGRKKQP